jgi:cyclopropane-fatty-acyl-phospholipid synthase
MIPSRIAESVVRSRLAALTTGSLVLRHGTDVARFGPGGADSPKAEITVHDGRLFAALALGGHVGAAEAYMDGHWTTPDLTAVIRLFLRNRDALDGLEKGLARLAIPLRALLHKWNQNTRSGARRNIHAHYDLGNEFFAHFLDETMTYSAGLFEGGSRSMKQASEAKYDRICRKLGLHAGLHVIEIGTGWGGFALHAAERYGCRVTTTTISRRQHERATERVRDAGLEDRVEVIMRDYRDLTGTYDRLVSIEMIEAVGHHYFETYFRTCASLLSPDGLAAIQAITIQDRYYEAARKEVDFIKRYVFPGSCIPSVSVLAGAAASTDLRLVHLDDMTRDYAETLRRWRHRFFERWQGIQSLGFDERFKRLWDFYFSYCEGGFDEAVLGSVQLTFAKPAARPSVPLLPGGTRNAGPDATASAEDAELSGAAR